MVGSYVSYIVQMLTALYLPLLMEVWNFLWISECRPCNCNLELLSGKSLWRQLYCYWPAPSSSCHPTFNTLTICWYRVAQKELMFLKWVVVGRFFFLWGYLKSKVYVQKPRTVDNLKVSIRKEIATVPQEMLVNVMQNFEERLRTCIRQEGRHLSDIIFRNWVINVSNQNCIYYRLFWC